MTTPDYSPNYSPDGLTAQDITALQAEVTAELRREGHLPPPRRRRIRRRSARPSGAARRQSAPTSPRPVTRPSTKRGKNR